MDGSAVGWLDQHFDARVGELLDMARSQRRPPLPRVYVFTADGHDSPVVLIAPLACEAALRPLSLVTEESEHGSVPHLHKDTAPQTDDHDNNELVPSYRYTAH